jgi:Protein of unknown function (DUF1761)
MAFAGMNYLAVMLAAVAAWLVGAAWYGVLAKPWVAAQGKTMEEFKAQQEAMRASPVAYAPFIIAFLAELVMAWMLAGVLGHLGPGQVTLRNGVITAFFLWLGFVVTTMAVNYAFGARKPMLLAIDAGHWLAVLLVEGAIIGAMGVR